MTALVVAPSAIAARIVEQVVRKAGCSDVRCVHSAAEAAAALRGRPEPALLATEWDLPDGSGLDLARSVRDTLGRPDLPVLLVGTRNTRDDVLEALAAGIDLYVLKPIDPDVLAPRVAALLPESETPDAARNDEPEAAAA